jgi:hypothetical protein
MQLKNYVKKALLAPVAALCLTCSWFVNFSGVERKGFLKVFKLA